MRKLGPTAVQELLEIVMCHDEQASTLLTSNPVEDWGNCWATVPPSQPCSMVCFTTAISSNADRGDGEPKQTYLVRRNRVKKIMFRVTS